MVLGLLFLLCSCAHSPTTIETIQTCDEWWRGIRNEDANFYQTISINEHFVVHLCGSRARMFAEFNKIHPDRPLTDLLADNTYMFTIHYPKADLVHTWLVVKIVNGKVVFHKWATGHEFIRLLSLHTSNLLKADKY